MIRFKGFDLTALMRTTAVLAVAVSLAGVAVTDADAQRRRNNNQEQSEEEAAAERTFSAAIGQIVLDAQTAQGEERFADSITLLNQALGNSDINPYERSVSLQMRGRAYFETDRTALALRDWEGAIETGAMLPSEIVNLRVNIGQLYIIEENYDAGIRSFELAIQAGAEMTAPLSKMLAQAYAQAERYRDGLVHAERFWSLLPTAERQRGDYMLMLFFYQQLDDIPNQMRIVEAMVGRWPDDKRNWTSYASLLAQVGRESDAFEANKVMYLNGMLTESRELVRIAQYYSFYEYPFRGAVILERELNAGRVERNRENLSLLANMWRQSREWERAVPVLRQLAQLTGAGPDWEKLGEAHYQLKQLAEAETAFQEALERGGLNRPGTTWTLLGNVRYELGQRQSAIQAFQQGTSYPYSRRTASGWVNFVRNEIQGEINRAARREQIFRDECRLNVDALMGSAQILGTVAIDERTGEERLAIEVPEQCQSLYNQFGDEIEEVEEASAETDSSEESSSAG
ncbi:tetratricopeptide repeat protein [Maricaulis sp. D1M11]|uniref:tetratricopeptide repeat protein n=1 Tax=Maricaulis sp. D1M11 TaxID=3076117 RepID=UPI0039B40709